MTRLTIGGLIAVASLVTATTMLRSHTWPIVGTTGANRLAVQESQTRSQADKLPVQDFDDRSLVFPRER